MRDDLRRLRLAAGLLVLACVALMTLDSQHATSSSPVDVLRSAVGAVLGPAESTAGAAVRPVTSLRDHFGSVSDLQARNDALATANDTLRTRLRAQLANDTRGDEVASIGSFADAHGYSVVPAQVVALGPAQSFSRTVTIDAGTNDGVVPDLTVVNADGLVGRVLEATASTATVLLVIDSESTVGGRLSSSMELGFLDGSGNLSGAGRLTLSLVDHTVSPKPGDTVLTWGSRNSAPYLPGIPIGTVLSVHSSPAELTETAAVDTFVDFSTLDVVGVITADDTSGTTVASGTGR